MSHEVEQIIAGSIFDFAAFLTCQETPITIGSAFNSGTIVPLIEEFSKMRGLSLEGADVQGWQDKLNL
jgi:peptide subunit release factor RF-3